jgi:hypothetical protein
MNFVTKIWHTNFSSNLVSGTEPMHDITLTNELFGWPMKQFLLHEKKKSKLGVEEHTHKQVED